MATKKSPRRPSSDPKNAVKSIIYANDTSSTTSSSRRRQPASTMTLHDEFQGSSEYDLEPGVDNASTQQETPGEIVLKWLKDHWAIVVFVLTSAAASIVWATRIEGKVDVLSSYTTEIRGSVEKLKSDSVRTGTQVEHLQHSMGRIEDQQFSKKK